MKSFYSDLPCPKDLLSLHNKERTSVNTGTPTIKILFLSHIPLTLWLNRFVINMVPKVLRPSESKPYITLTRSIRLRETHFSKGLPVYQS